MFLAHEADEALVHTSSTHLKNVTMCWGQSSLPRPTGGLLASGCSGENRWPETVLSDSLEGLASFQGIPHGNARSLPFLNPVFNSLGPLGTSVLSEVSGVIVTSLLANDRGCHSPFSS